MHPYAQINWLIWLDLLWYSYNWDKNAVYAQWNWAHLLSQTSSFNVTQKNMYSVTQQGWLGVPFQLWWSYDVIFLSASVSFSAKRHGQYLVWGRPWFSLTQFLFLLHRSRILLSGTLHSKANLNGTEEETALIPLSQRQHCSGQCHRTLNWPISQSLLCARDFVSSSRHLFLIFACLLCRWCLGLLKNSIWMKLTAK